MLYKTTIVVTDPNQSQYKSCIIAINPLNWWSYIQESKAKEGRRETVLMFTDVLK